jgi:signal transduction histidine kinase
MVFIHWKTVETVHQSTAKISPLYQRLKTLDQLSLSLERYRRVSTGFRNLSPGEILEAKDHLSKKFDDGLGKLEQLDLSAEDRNLQGQLKNQLNTLLEAIAEVEPTLYSKDAYVKPNVQQLHDQLLQSVSLLVKSTDHHVSGLRLDGSAATESRSVLLLIAVGLVILGLMALLILKNYISYQKPLNSLHLYASGLREGKNHQHDLTQFKGVFGDIHSVLAKLSNDVETLVKNRHRFILDIVDDLQGPLQMLQVGKLLLSPEGEAMSGEDRFKSLDSARRGLAIFAGSLEDLSDIVEINQMDSRLSESTVDLSELLSDVARVLFGSEYPKKMSISVPPIPVWVNLDVRRFERVLLHVISKVMGTLSSDRRVAVSVTQGKGNFRGIEVVVHGSELENQDLPVQRGPEQDILKHWISEHGLCMRLVQKIIKVHGGTITAAGIVGSHVQVLIKIPHERVSATGLIAPPTEDLDALEPAMARSLVFQKNRSIEEGQSSAS